MHAISNWGTQLLYVTLSVHLFICFISSQTCSSQDLIPIWEGFVPCCQHGGYKFISKCSIFTAWYNIQYSYVLKWTSSVSDLRIDKTTYVCPLSTVCMDHKLDIYWNTVLNSILWEFYMQALFNHKNVRIFHSFTQHGTYRVKII